MVRKTAYSRRIHRTGRSPYQALNKALARYRRNPTAENRRKAGNALTRLNLVEGRRFKNAVKAAKKTKKNRR